MRVYHGGYCEIKTPEIRLSGHNKDFGQGFYCTGFQIQAKRWAKRFEKHIVSVFDYVEIPDVDILRFETMTEEWLDFIVDCRSGKPHGHEIVTGAMANDQVWNYIADYIDGILTREQFWALAKFKRPTHQIAFCSPRSLSCLTFIESYGA
ncbi:MAG: DUF3990 domain-containing protein [Chitinispirillales bacterium]|jgi:hypothetical protein|nr:DUF3990 domain-containing protein [Chitinispirillales bacterium]